MAAYSGYQMPQYAQGPPPGQPYGQQQQQHQYPPQQQQQQQQPNMFLPTTVNDNLQHGSAPRRGSIQRSMSFDPAQSPGTSQSMALVSFDPYASTPAPAPNADPFAPSAPPAPAYNNYALPPTPNAMSQSVMTTSPYGVPPSYNNEEMTTTPLNQSQFGNQFNPYASAPPAVQHQQHNQFDPAASTVSDISMFTNAVVPAAPKVRDTESALALAEKGDFSEGSADPELIAEQERIWQEIQDRRKMERIRADGGIPNPRAVVPYDGNRRAPPRTRSMPMKTQRGQENSIARGGMAVLDPKKDKRKQTRKMKTAAGTVGGAVVGGLVLGPVGVVLGAGGGAVVANKAAKSRDKRKQQEFEQKNFQRGAANSRTATGDGAFA